MTTLMRDSTNPAAIPTDTPIVAGYSDGLYVWSAEDWARFPTAAKRRISTTTVNTPSDTADIESGNLSAVERLTWYRNMTALGETNLWLYVNRSNQHATEDIFWNAGIRDVKMWVATLDGTMTVQQYRYPVAAVQYHDTGAYDESVVYDAAYGGEIGGLPVTESEKRAWVNMAFVAGCLRVPEPGASLDATITAIHDNGDNVAEEIMKILTSPEATEKLAKLTALVSAPAASVAAHKHLLSLGTETGDVA